MQGRVHSIQSLGTVDGPGVRAVLFLQGCPLRCPYCHNPDTWDTGGGTLMDTAEVLRRLLRYRGYFGKRGGVTVSGGEPLLQAAFVRELFDGLRREGVHTALDTSGCLMNGEVEKLLDVTDLALLDVKMSSDEAYRRHIGISLRQVMDFLMLLEEKGVSVWIRQVVVPGVNDTPDDMRRLQNLLEGFSCIKKVELLPFRKLCLEKYQQMGIAFPLQDVPEASIQDVARLQKLFDDKFREQG